MLIYWNILALSHHVKTGTTLFTWCNLPVLQLWTYVCDASRYDTFYLVQLTCIAIRRVFVMPVGTTPLTSCNLPVLQLDVCLWCQSVLHFLPDATYLYCNYGRVFVMPVSTTPFTSCNLPVLQLWMCVCDASHYDTFYPMQLTCIAIRRLFVMPVSTTPFTSCNLPVLQLWTCVCVASQVVCATSDDCCLHMFSAPSGRSLCPAAVLPSATSHLLCSAAFVMVVTSRAGVFVWFVTY